MTNSCPHLPVLRRSLDWELCNSRTPHELHQSMSGKAAGQLQGLHLGLSHGLLLPKLSMHEHRASAYAAAEAAQLEAKLETAAMAKMTAELRQRNEEAARRRREQWERHPIAALMLAADAPLLTATAAPQAQPPQPPAHAAGKRLQSPGHEGGAGVKIADANKTGIELMSLLNTQAMQIRPNGTPPSPGPPQFGKPSCYELGLPPMLADDA